MHFRPSFVTSRHVAFASWQMQSLRQRASRILRYLIPSCPRTSRTEARLPLVVRSVALRLDYVLSHTKQTRWSAPPQPVLSSAIWAMETERTDSVGSLAWFSAGGSSSFLLRASNGFGGQQCTLPERAPNTILDPGAGPGRTRGMTLPEPRPL